MTKLIIPYRVADTLLQLLSNNSNVPQEDVELWEEAYDWVIKHKERIPAILKETDEPKQ